MIKEIGTSASQQKIIETNQLLIKGNIMSWYGTMIQLSNVSCISTKPLEQTMFPASSITLLLIGTLAFIFSLIVGIVSLGSKQHMFSTVFVGLIVSMVSFGLGFTWIYTWYKTNEDRKTHTILNIIMNSGNNLQFVINNRNFLDKVLKVLEEIIIDGGVGKQNVSINIQGCEITGNAKVLNDLDLL